MTKGCIIHKILLAGCCFFSTWVINAQVLETRNAAYPPFDPGNLIRNVFLGQGVEVLDVQFSGNAEATGYFKNAAQSVGFEDGIVLTTGLVQSQRGLPGIDTTANMVAGADNGSVVFDEDIARIVGGLQFTNVTRYIIRFIPVADTLRFRYVFASEEYPEYVCTPFNDVFGFFISGPGIDGPFQNNARNIALIPGTDLPVRVNNINGGRVGGQGGKPEFCRPPNGSLDYSFLYHDHAGGRPVFDGFTTPLTAEVVVQPCKEYTIKLVIADINDANYDSGVFLEAKSFGTSAVDLTVDMPGLDGSMVEGCSPGSIALTLPGPAAKPVNLDVQIGGMAREGKDYEALQRPFVIPAGEQQLVIPFNPIADTLQEGIENIFISVKRDACHLDTLSIQIRDQPEFDWRRLQDTVVCPGSFLEFDLNPPQVAVNDLRFTYRGAAPILNGAAGQYFDLPVQGVSPSLFNLKSLEAVCIDSLDHDWLDDLDLYLVAPNGQFVELSTDNGRDGGNGLEKDRIRSLCFSPTAALSIKDAAAVNGTFSGVYQPEGDWSGLEGCPSNGRWRLLVVDDTPSATGTFFSWSLRFKPAFSLKYEWFPGNDLSCSTCSSSTWVADSDRDFLVRAIDNYGCIYADSFAVRLSSKSSLSSVQCWKGEGDLTGLIRPAFDTALLEVRLAGASEWQLWRDSLFSVNVIRFDEDLQWELRTRQGCLESGNLTCRTNACLIDTVFLKTIKMPSCAGFSDGSFEVFPADETETYSYTLDGQSQSSPLFEGLPSGKYTLEVKSGQGCSGRLEIVLADPDTLQLNVDTLSDISCPGAQTGSMLVNVTGGSAPYLFEWSNGQTSDSALQLSAGQHSVTVSDQNGCSAIANATLAEPDSMAIQMKSQTVSCPKSKDGYIEVEVSGGLAPYEYSWQPETGASGQPLVENLGVGIYTVLVKDANGCTAVGTAALDMPVDSGNKIVVKSTVVNSGCPGADRIQIALDPTGGQEPYRVLWQDGLEAPVRRNLAPGQYAFMVEDEEGCIASDTILAHSLSIPDIEIMVQEETCAGAYDGFLSVVGAETKWPGWRWRWSTGDTTSWLDGLSSGKYVVTGIQPNGCGVRDTVVLQALSRFQVETMISGPSCYGRSDGKIALDVSGGELPYDLYWNGKWQAFTDTLSGLNSGKHEIRISDANGCEWIALMEVPPAFPLILDAGQPDVELISGDSIHIAVELSENHRPVQLQWRTGDGLEISCGTCKAAWVQAFHSNRLTILAEDDLGCKGETSVDFRVLERELAGVPNVFSPNGDGQNDYLTVYGRNGLEVKQFQVFNRWGELVFSRKNYRTNEDLKGWDGQINGRPAPGGAYIWTASVVMPDGTVRNIQGSTVLLR